MFRIDSDHGYLTIGENFAISWGNTLPELGIAEDIHLSELAGFFTISIGRYALEFGDIDQGEPGIYLTETDEIGNVNTIKTFAQF